MLFQVWLRDLLDGLCDAPIPASLNTLLAWPVSETPFLPFKAAPIITYGESQNVRVYVSNAGEEGGFVQRVSSVIADPRIAAFYQRVPGTRVRRMIDTDGVNHVLFLDDLQAVSHDLLVPADAELMCAGFNLGSGAEFGITRHPRPPEGLEDRWQRVVDQWCDRGFDGLWGLRWGAAGLEGLLYVEESVHRGSPEVAATRIDSWDCPRWALCREAAARRGWVAYPDAVELFDDGGLDLTVGFWNPPMARDI